VLEISVMSMQCFGESSVIKDIWVPAMETELLEGMWCKIEVSNFKTACLLLHCPCLGCGLQ